MSEREKSTMLSMTVDSSNIDKILPPRIYLDKLLDHPSKDLLKIHFSDKEHEYVFHFRRVIAYRHIMEEFALMREDSDEEKFSSVKIIEDSSWIKELIASEPQFKFTFEKNPPYHFIFITPISITDVLCETLPTFIKIPTQSTKG